MLFQTIFEGKCSKLGKIEDKKYTDNRNFHPPNSECWTRCKMIVYQCWNTFIFSILFPSLQYWQYFKWTKKKWTKGCDVYKYDYWTEINTKIKKLIIFFGTKNEHTTYTRGIHCIRFVSIGTFAQLLSANIGWPTAITVKMTYSFEILHNKKIKNDMIKFKINM